MNLKDKHGRWWFVANHSRSGYVLQIGPVFVNLMTGRLSIMLSFGFDGRWLADQPKTPRCRACRRWVTTPCNNAEGFYENGPWDGSCQYIFEPWRDR